MAKEFSKAKKIANEETMYRASITKKYPDGRIITYEVSKMSLDDDILEAELSSIKKQDAKYYNAIHCNSTMNDIFEAFKEFESCIKWD